MNTKASLEILGQTTKDGTYFQETDLSHMQNVGHGQSYATMMTKEEKHESDMFQVRNGGLSGIGKLKPTKGKTEKLEELIAKSLADGGAVCLAGIDENMMERIMTKVRSLNSTTMVASQGVQDFSHEATTGRTRDGMKKYIPMEESFSFANKKKTQMVLSNICVDSEGYFEKKKAPKPYQALSKKR